MSESPAWTAPIRRTIGIVALHFGQAKQVAIERQDFGKRLNRDAHMGNACRTW